MDLLKKKTLRLAILIFMGLLISCSSTKEQMTAKESTELETILMGKDFSFEATFAFPRVTNSMAQLANAGLLAPGSNAARINLMGSANYMTFQNDTIQASLPYFGERQLVSTYGNRNVGIEFDGPAENLVIEMDKKGSSYLVQFSGQSSTESYRVIMNVYPNKTAYVTITSSHRFPIGYSGFIKEHSVGDEKEKAQSTFN